MTIYHGSGKNLAWLLEKNDSGIRGGNEDLRLILSLERFFFSKCRNNQKHSPFVKRLVKLNILSAIDSPCVYFAKQNSKLRAINKELEDARLQEHRVRIQVVLTNI